MKLGELLVGQLRREAAYMDKDRTTWLVVGFYEAKSPVREKLTKYRSSDKATPSDLEFG